MAIRMICPCKQELLTDDTSVGLKVRCPSCNVLLLVPDVLPKPTTKKARSGSRPAREEAITERPPQRKKREDYPPEDDYEDEEEEYEDRPRRRRQERGSSDRKKALGIVKVGVLIIFICLLANVIGMGLNILGILVGLVLPPVVAILGLLSMGIGLLTLMAYLVGGILCCFAPEKSKAKPMMIYHLSIIYGGTLALCGIWVIAISVMGASMAAVGNAGGRPGPDFANSISTGMIIMAIVVGILALAMVFGAIITFYQYFSRLCDYLKERALASEAEDLQKMAIMLMVGAIIIYVVMFGTMLTGVQALMLIGSIIAGIGGLVLLVFEIILVVRNITFLGNVRGALADRA